MTIFFLKVAVPAVLVAAISLIARWRGPTFASLLIGLPWMTAPVLFFLALDKGDAFAVAACVGVELGVVGIAAYILAYGAVASIARWPFALTAAVVAFFASMSILKAVLLPLPLAAVAAAAALALCWLLLPRPRAPSALRTLPWWDLPVRVLTTIIIVSAILLGADLLGGQLSGMAATFPVILTVIGTFTHAQWGFEASRRMLRGVAVSLMALVVFFLVAGIVLPTVGLVVSFVMAFAAAVTVSAGLLRTISDRKIK